MFLLGLGIGSTIGAMLARDVTNARRALGWCQLLLCGAMAWAAYELTESLPYWPINPYIATTPWFTLQLDLARCLWVVLPGAILWGASFPLALSAVATTEQDAAWLAGGVYAANTVGAIVGSLAMSFVLVPWIGSSHSEQVLIIASALSALILLEPSFAGAADASSGVPGTSRWNIGGTIVLALAMVGAGLLARSVHQLPGLLVAYGRYSATRVGQADIIYVGEGLNASVAVSQLSNGVLNYHNAGKVQASSEPQDMRLQRMLGHLTTLIPEHARRVVVIGCGAGVTAGAVSIDPAVEHETIAEIEPLVPEVVSNYFSEHNFDVVRNPKVHVRIDDARHFIQTTNEKFDAITSDPLDPWVKGAAMLYTKEFFETAKAHLNPGGVMTLFVQLYESNSDAVKSEIATFLDAFPNGIVWGNTNEGKGYDLVLLGQAEPTKIDVDAIEAQAAAAGVREGEELARADRHALGGRSLLNLRRPQARPRAVAAQRHHQPRSQSPAAVPGGSRAELVSGRRDLRGHAEERQQAARRICSSDPRRRRTPCLRRLRAHRESNARRRFWDGEHAKNVVPRIRCDRPDSTAGRWLPDACRRAAGRARRSQPLLRPPLADDRTVPRRTRQRRHRRAGQPNVFYMGSVGGGVWKTTNAGRTWLPIFDSQPIASIGAVAVAPSRPDVVYVGTGEADMRSQISYGNGMYKSTDAGKTWTHIGLEPTRQIGKVDRRSARPECRVRGRARSCVWREPGSRRLPDARRRRDMAEGAVQEQRRRRD